ncbi:MAG: TIGR03545 family protein, partial [Planctomycetota bacterium]
PRSDAKRIRLGDDDEIGISVSGGKRELWVQFLSQGDQLEGRLVSQQTGVTMKLDVDPRYAELPAVTAIRDSLARADRIEVDATFSGTWRDVNLDMTTNLGGLMKKASQEAIAKQLQASQQALTTKVQQAHLKHGRELEQWISQRQDQARGLLVKTDSSINEISEKIFAELGDFESQVSSRLGRLIGGALR